MSEVKPIPLFKRDNGLIPTPDLEWAFPQVDPGLQPFGSRVIVQLRRIERKVTAAGIILASETKEAEKWNNMVGKLVAVGPLAFLNRETMEPWPEGVWAKVGDFVRVPKWGGDRWERQVPGEDGREEPILFMTLNDHEIIARVTDNPLSFKAYL